MTLQAHIKTSIQLGQDPFEGTPYRAHRCLASGAIGEVFIVEHRERGGRMVAKLLRPRLLGDRQTVDRVRLEAQALGRLKHPNIVSVLDSGLTRNGRPYIIMEYLRGRTLAAELRSAGPLPPLNAIFYARQILSALAAVHAIGIVHRDIKPDNLILLGRTGAAPQLKVLDFSIARVMPGVSTLAPSPLEVPTDTGMIVGTPRYISPEAALGHHVDHRADLYGVGVVLYQMLTGQCPFDYAKNHSEELVAHITADPKPPSCYLPEPLEPGLDAAVLRALAKEPDARFQSAAEFDQVLAEIALVLDAGEDMSGVIQVDGSASGFSTVRRRFRRNRGPSWRNSVLLCVFVALATAIAVVLLGMRGGWMKP